MGMKLWGIKFSQHNQTDNITCQYLGYKQFNRHCDICKDFRLDVFILQGIVSEALILQDSISCQAAYHLNIAQAIENPPPVAQNRTTSPGRGPLPSTSASSKAIGIQAAPV